MHKMQQPIRSGKSRGSSPVKSQLTLLERSHNNTTSVQLAMQLQRSIGNQALCKMLSGNRNSSIEAKQAAVTASPRSQNPIQRVIKRKSTKEPYTKDDFEEGGRLVKPYGLLSALGKTVALFAVESSAVDWELSDSQKHLKEFCDWFLANKSAARDQFMGTLGYGEVIGFLRNGGKMDENIREALEDRKKALDRQISSDWGSTPNLHIPTMPTGAYASTNTNEASNSGRKDGSFIMGANTLPGDHGKTTSVVNIHLGKKAMDHHNYESVGSDHMSICPNCMHAVDVHQLEVDHQVAFADIKNRMFMLAQAMSTNSGLKKHISAELGDSFKHYFGGTTDLYPTAGAVKNYSNDITNLMHICRKCNGATGKSDQNFLEWYRESPLYGAAFLEAHYNPDQKAVLDRTKSGKGWGEAARDWFYTHHMPKLAPLLTMEQKLEPFRQSVRDETLTNYRESHTTIVSEKNDLKRKHDSLHYRNQTFLTHMNGLEETYMNNNPNDILSNFTPSSPKREERLEKDKRKKRRMEKEKEYREENIVYQRGFEAGRKGSDKEAFDPVNQAKEMKDYELGYTEGQTMQASDSINGYKDGISGKVNEADLQYPAYKKGVDEGKQRRKTVEDTGFNDGVALSDVRAYDSDVIDDSEIGSELLSKFYVQSYNAGKKTHHH